MPDFTFRETHHACESCTVLRRENERLARELKEATTQLILTARELEAASQ